MSDFSTSMAFGRKKARDSPLSEIFMCISGRENSMESQVKLGQGKVNFSEPSLEKCHATPEI
jgi:hypothetical protein